MHRRLAATSRAQDCVASINTCSAPQRKLVRSHFNKTPTKVSLPLRSSGREWRQWYFEALGIAGRKTPQREPRGRIERPKARSIGAAKDRFRGRSRSPRRITAALRWTRSCSSRRHSWHCCRRRICSTLNSCLRHRCCSWHWCRCRHYCRCSRCRLQTRWWHLPGKRQQNPVAREFLRIAFMMFLQYVASCPSRTAQLPYGSL